MFCDVLQMAGEPPEEQSKKAIGHILGIIRDHNHVGWYLGDGTQSFSLLTEAYSTLSGQPVAQVRDAYEPIRATNPQEEE